jgi:hypothetical protein
MIFRRTVVCSLATLLLASIGLSSQAEPELSLWAERKYNGWENPLHSEVTINDKLVNIFTSDTMEPLAGGIKPGWNTIQVKTTPQEPAKNGNGLTFRVGPTRQDPAKKRVVMSPVIWEFRNDSDWKLQDSAFSHPLGPTVKEVILNYRLYYAGLQHEGAELKAGDYVLRGKPKYNGWNSPVVATVSVNGTMLNSFTLAARNIIITPFLKPGRNEIKIISERVPDTIVNNDIEFSVAGPAEWEVSNNRFTVRPIVQFNAMQGWERDVRSGQLRNPLKAGANTIERVVPFVMKPTP